jgi:hypothetical protein
MIKKQKRQSIYTKKNKKSKEKKEKRIFKRPVVRIKKKTNEPT